MIAPHRRLIAVAVLVACSAACKTTYTPEDLREVERQQHEDILAAGERAEHGMASGNREALRELEEEVTRETDR